MNTLKQLLRISGKVLFIIGFVLNVLMVFFGIWPTYLYLLIMLFGLALALLIKPQEEHTTRINFKVIEESIKKASSKIDVTYFKKILLKIIIGCLIALVALVVLFILYRPYQKKNQTINECEEIVAAIKSYKQNHNSYPNTLNDIIGNNPLRRDWYKDSWNNNYVYENRNGSFVLISKGKDGLINTQDDLKYSY